MLNPIKPLAQKLSSSYAWTATPLIICAPMRILSGPALAVAVAQAGGLGFIGPSAKTQGTHTDLEEAASLLQQAREANPTLSASVLPVGVGFQLWNDEAEVAFSAIEKYKPCAAWLYAPRDGQQDFDAWTQRIRLLSPQTQVWVQIGTLGEAREIIASDARPDVVVVQGAEAGGHGRARDGMGLMALLPEISDAFRQHEILIVAAGGIADGRGIAAALCLGAAGVAMGTRFLAANEARISKGYQREVVRATAGAVSTTRTTLYNELRGTVGWPECYSPRTIVNRSWVENQEGVPFGELKRRHDEAAKTGDAGWGPEGRLATYAGAAVGLIHQVEDAGEIIKHAREEACRYIVGLQDE